MKSEQYSDAFVAATSQIALTEAQEDSIITQGIKKHKSFHGLMKANLKTIQSVNVGAHQCILYEGPHGVIHVIPVPP